MSMHLNKYLAYAGISSRRNAVEFINKGKVSVNGTIIKEPGYIVQDGDIVRLNNKVITLQKNIYVLLNKPKGFITSTEDDLSRDTVMDLLKPKIKERLYPVGRLDRDTTGLLLLTNDGMLAQRLSHPSHEVSKIYQVTLDAPLHYDHEKQIKEGVVLKDGLIKADAISVLNKVRTRLKIQLHSGKNRIIRRLFKHIGYHVLKLDRIVYANLSKKGLPVGMWRFLTTREIDYLKSLLITSSSKNSQKHQE